MNVAKRSIDSVTWNLLSNLIILPIGFIHSIILARFLPVEYFGIFGGVVALVILVTRFFDFGLTPSFLHRSNETEDEFKAIENLFTLRLLLSSIQVLFLITIGVIFFSGSRQTVLLVLALTGFFTSILSTPKLLLTRQIKFKPLAILNIASTLISAITASIIAIVSSSIWALLSSSITSLIVLVIFFYIWKPNWKPRLSVNFSIIKYYIRYGSRVQIGDLLSVILDNIDDLWTNLYLGDIPLGFYSRAYKFATYPRSIIVMPIQTVANSTYAELKFDRKRLSQAFFRVNAFLIRAGFLIAGLFFIISPQFIRIFLGEEWMPMLLTFRLLLIFAMLDPIKGSIANVLIASGVPNKLIRIRFFQLVFLIFSLFSLGNIYGTIGVAMSMDIMLFIGIVALYNSVRPYVDFSLRRLFLSPVISLSLSLTITRFILDTFLNTQADWISLGLGSITFLTVSLGSLIILEGKDLYTNLFEIIKFSAWKKH